MAPMAGDWARSATERMFSRAQRRPVSARYSFGLLVMERVRLEIQGSSKAICPEASRMDSHWLGGGRGYPHVPGQIRLVQEIG